MRVLGLKMGVCAAALLLAAPGMAPAAGKPTSARPWMNAKLSPDARADLVLAKLSLDQQIALLHGSMPLFMGAKRPAGVQVSAGLSARCSRAEYSRPHRERRKPRRRQRRAQGR